MVSPIECNNHDFSMYYADTILIYQGVACICHGAAAYDEDDEEFDPDEYSAYLFEVGEVDISDLSVKFLPSLYTAEGRWVGNSTRRSYKRAPSLHDWEFKVYQERLSGIEPMEFNGKRGRIGFEFYVADDAAEFITVFHRGRVCGFVESDVFYIRGDDIVERLSDKLRVLGGNYAIQCI